MDDSQEQTGSKALEALGDSALARRIMARQTRPVGVINMHHTQEHYSRLTEWSAQRLGLLDQLKERYDPGHEQSATSNMVYASAQEPQHDAASYPAQASFSTFADATTETPAKSPTVASASSEKFRISRKPNSAAGKSAQQDSPATPARTTLSEMRAQTGSQAESVIASPSSGESLQRSSETSSDQMPKAATPVLRLSRKKAGQSAQKTSAPQTVERVSAPVADTPLPQAARASETVMPQSFPVERAMPFVKPLVDERDTGQADEREIIQRATVETALAASTERASVPSTLGQQSTASDQSLPAKALLLRKPQIDGAVTPQPQSDAPESFSRTSAANGDAASRGMTSVSETGGAQARPLAPEMKGAVSERPASERLPFVKAQTVASPLVQLKRRDAASRDDGPTSQAEERAGRTQAALAVEMRPASSGAQASAIVWRKSAGDSAQHDRPPSMNVGGAAYSSSLPLNRVQVQRQVNDEGDAAPSSSSSVAQRMESAPSTVTTQAAPEVDLDQITEHVSRAIFRQLAIERERRGF